MANRARIGKQTELSTASGSLVRTDGSNEQEYFAPGADGTMLRIVAGVPTWATFISTDADNSVSVGTDGGAYYNAPAVVAGAAWDDVNNQLVLTFDDASVVNVPIVDTVASFLHTHTMSDGTTTTDVTNGDTVTYSGTQGVTATVSADALAIGLPAGTTDGDLLVWDTATSAYISATQAAQISFSITDGTTTEVVNDAETVTFAKAGNVIDTVAVTATNTVTITATELKDTFAGLAAGTTVTLSQTPVAGAVLEVNRNGVEQELTTDYTVAGLVLTFGDAFGASTGATATETVTVRYFRVA